jgi:LemA protein
MSKSLWALVFAGFVVLLFWGGYNSLATKNVAVDSAWSEVQNQLKRRADLIPNLVSTVQGYATHEKDVFTAVTEARAQVSQSVNIDASKLANDPALQKQLLDAQNNLNASLGKLIAVAEAYPDLKAAPNFAKLQDELAGTENRIAVARGRAIAATQSFNSSVVTFPNVLLAGIFGFQKKEFYVAPEGSETVPVVKFGG